MLPKNRYRYRHVTSTELLIEHVLYKNVILKEKKIVGRLYQEFEHRSFSLLLLLSRLCQIRATVTLKCGIIKAL